MFKTKKNKKIGKYFKNKKSVLISLFIFISFISFGLGYGLHDEIKQAFTGKPELVWGLTSTGIVILISLILVLIIRRVLRPFREKRELRKLEKVKLEHELEKIKEEQSNVEGM